MTEEILRKLQSSEYLDHISGLDDLIPLNDKIAAIAIDDLEKAETKDFIAERIFMIIQSYIKKLRKLGDTTADEDLKFNCYMILLTNDIHHNDQFLVEYLSKAKEFTNYLWAMNRLVQKGVADIIPVIKERIKLVQANTENYPNHEILLYTLQAMLKEK